MKILFLTLANINNIDGSHIYTDLIRKFRDEGHKIFIVSPSERRMKQKTSIKKYDRTTLLNVKILNIQKTNVIEKGLSTLLIESQYLKGVKKYFEQIKFDLVLYSTPPITFSKIIRYIKQRDNAKTYLLLKDIFPQNAVDLKIMKEGGIMHMYFRKKEKSLYKISDHIGCMSPANLDYLIKNNPEINCRKVEVNPNSIKPKTNSLGRKDRVFIRKKYNIPINSNVFIYGGNLGKPQGIDFLLEIINSNSENENTFFVIVGSGTEFNRIQKWFETHEPNNALLISGLPKDEYDKLLSTCDVGLIFLDNKFTIPNFPSRLLSYLEYKMPVIVATDPNTDIGKIAEKNNFGFYSIHGDLIAFNNHLDKITGNFNLKKEMGENGFRFLLDNYTVTNSYQIIMKHFEEKVT